MDSRAVEELIDLGDQHLANKQWEEADNVFQQVLSCDVRSKRALLGRAVVLRQGWHDFELAQRFLNRCLYYYPGDTEALTEYGRLYAAQWDHKKSVAFFDQALSRDPTNRQALHGKIQSLLAQGITSEAHKLIESVAPTTPRPPWLLLELARIYVAEGAYDAAVEAFLDAGKPEELYGALDAQIDRNAKDLLARAIVSRLGDNAQALSAVTGAHSNWDDLDSAIEISRKLVQAAPKDESAYLQLINLLRQQEQFSDAEAAYQSAVRSLGRTSDSLLVARARVFFDSHKRDHGIEALCQLLDPDQLLSALDEVSDDDATHIFEALIERPQCSTAVLNKAAGRLAGLGNRPRALELLERILELDPNDIGAVVAKGEILLGQERLNDLDTLLKRSYPTFGKNRGELLSLESRLLIAHERYGEAVRVAVLADSEKDIREHVDSLREQGNLAKAEKLVNAAVAECPDSISFLKAKGKLLMEQGNYDDAAKVWNAIREKQPGQIDALLQQTFALRSARRFQEVAQIVNTAMRRVSVNDRPTLLLELGFLHYDQSEYEEAVQAFDAALAANPDYDFAHLCKVRALRISGSRDQAELAVKEALTARWLSDTVRAGINCEMGKLHDAREEWKSAVSSYSEAILADPDLVEPHFLKASALLRLGLDSEAELLVERILGERDLANEVKEQAGWFYLSKKEFQKAETLFKKILSRSASDFGAINGLGGVYYEQGKFDLAEKNFRRALSMDKSDAVLWTNLAWALVRQVGSSAGSPDPLLAEAESSCRKAIELSAKYPDAYACLGLIAFKRGHLLESEENLKHANQLVSKELNSSYLGALYAYLGRYKDARKILEKGREFDRYDVAVRIELGNVYLQLGRTKDAITVLKEACAINPQAEEALRALSVALSKGGHLIEAQRVLRNAIPRQDRSGAPSLRLALSQVLTELADKTGEPELYAEALKEARLAIAAQPSNPDAYFQAGVLCFKQDDHRAALKHFKKCHELDSNNFEADQNIRKLKALRRQEIGRARIGAWVGFIVGIICFALLIVIWWIYLQQPIPQTKETIRQIDSTMLLTLSPILLALVFVALLMPWLSKVKLPGGVEAELVQPKEKISPGPSGPLTISLESSTISAGPK